MLPSLLLGSKEGMKIKKWDVELVLWGLKLLYDSTAGKHKKHTLALLALALKSKDLLGQMLEEVPLAFDYEERGKLHVYTSGKELEAAQRFAHMLEGRYSIKQEVLGEQACRAKAPAYCAHIDTVAGGVFSPLDALGDCQKFCEGLIAHLQKDPRFSIRYGEKIERWEHSNDTVGAMVTSKQTVIKADAFLLCTGGHTNTLLRMVGQHVPVYPIKGYSLVTPMPDVARYVPYSITDHALKMVYAPLGDTLRVSGLFHFSGHDATIEKKAVGYMKRSIHSRLPEVSLSDAEIMVGFRPSTPSSVPIIGTKRFENLYVNTGQGMLGWTLAHASAKKAADLIV
jgi:D-amino-acid dehydrogenase